MKMSKSDILSVLKDYMNQFAGIYGILDIGLFGSVARDEAKVDSDVDIFISMKNPNIITLSRIRVELEERIKTHVDLIHYQDKMNPYLKSRIEKEGVHVYGSYYLLFLFSLFKITYLPSLS
jgi:predicted nucleotidyltransferase